MHYTIYWIKIRPVNNAIGFPNTISTDHYPVDSAIQCLNNWGQILLSHSTHVVIAHVRDVSDRPNPRTKLFGLIVCTPVEKVAK